MIAVGEERVYRQRETDPIQRVMIRSQVRDGQFPRYEVEFAAGDAAGQVLEIPARRLQVRWEHRDSYEAGLARTARIEAFEPTTVESGAIEHVFLLLVPDTVAHPHYSRATGATAISDGIRLRDLTGLSTDQLVRDIEWFEEDDYVIVSAEGGLRIAEAVCHRNPDVVLKWVDEDENKRRAECRRWKEVDLASEIDPDTAWWHYREHDRHVYELLRQWCGHRAITAYERIQAAEAEAHRLDDLLDRALHGLNKTDPRLAADLVSEWDAGRIRPSNYRAVVDRPLKPHELPVRTEHRPRRWPRT